MNIFEIEKLNCRYKDNRKNKFVDVLEVEDISIARGEITVILGPSGSGKSTFMESVSLMSDTIDRGNSKNVWFYSDKLSEAVKLEEINKDTGYLQKLRFDNFCFIFQDTNIMGNFNPIENVALPKMVDQKNDGEALGDAEDILRNQLGLRVNLRKKGFEYSGGQKQRFAFARAFLAKGEILFGDEPTGNLDKYNSEKLFNVINQNVNSSSGKKCNKIGAIIVTHSIELALQFADKIVVIVKPERIKINDQELSEKGYSNPFLTYHNSGKNAWRIETECPDENICNDLDDLGLLPLINDDDSLRYTFRFENDDQNMPMIKERLKNEIVFYLNNSYAHPQKILVEIAKKLNNQLKECKGNNEIKDKLFLLFVEIKKVVLEIINEEAGKRTTIKEFDKLFLNELRVRFGNNTDILSLIPVQTK